MVKNLQLFLLFFVTSMMPWVALYAQSKHPCKTFNKPDLNNDGIVNYKDLWRVGHSFGRPVDSSHFLTKADTNCDGQVDSEDWDYIWNALGKNVPIHPETSGFIELSTPHSIYLGHEIEVSRHVSLSSYNQAFFSAEIWEDVIPKTGLGAKNLLNHKVIQSQKTSHNYELYLQEIPPLVLKPDLTGDYQISIHALIPETGEIITKPYAITVLPAREAKLSINLSISERDANQFDRSYVKSTVQVKGKDADDIEKIFIVDENTGKSYFINEVETDIPVHPYFYMKNQCNSFHALAITDYDRVVSESVKLCGTKRVYPLLLPPDLHLYYCLANHYVVIAHAYSKLPEKILEQILQEARARITFRSNENDMHIYFLAPEKSLSEDVWIEMMTAASVAGGGYFRPIQGHGSGQDLNWCQGDLNGIELMFDAINSKLLPVK